MRFSTTVIPKEISDRFDRYLQRNDSGCLIYIGGKVKGGYGWFNAPGELPKQAHRFSFLREKKFILLDLKVCHTCDIPACCEPLHLFQGTSQDNMDDMKSKGRSPVNKGEQNPNAKLSDIDVETIRNIKKATDCSYVSLSEQFKVSPEMISYICRGLYRI